MLYKWVSLVINLRNILLFIYFKQHVLCYVLFQDGDDVNDCSRVCCYNADMFGCQINEAYILRNMSNKGKRKQYFIFCKVKESAN